MSNMGFKGFYKVLIHSGDENKPKRVVDWFPNLITNLGLNAHANQADVAQYIRLGSSSQTPAASDTGLINPFSAAITGVVDGIGNSTTIPYYSWLRKKYRFDPGQAVGNASEVSVSYSSSNTQAYSRALITEEGSPITITILPEDYVTIYYELRLYADTEDHTGTVNINGNEHTYRIRPCNLGSWNFSYHSHMLTQHLYYCTVYTGSLGAVTQLPSGNQAGFHIASHSQFLPYVSDSFEHKFNFTIPIQNCNLVGGIRSMVISNYMHAFQVEFDPPIPKTDQNTLTMSFKYKWGRAQI